MGYVIMVIDGKVRWDMYIETERLMIRSMEQADTDAFIEMTSDGSLGDIFGCFGEAEKCYKWMGKWIRKSILLEKENNPARDYLVYTIVETPCLTEVKGD